MIRGLRAVPLAAALLGLATVEPATAGTIEFNGYCTLGDFKVCSSVHVSVSPDGKTVTVHLWNLEQNDSYADTWGQASTITALGLYHSDPIYKFTGTATLQSVYFAGTDITSYWGGKGEKIGNLAGVTLEAVAATRTGHAGGVVGCTDPGGRTHFSTCNSFPGDPRLTITFTTDEVFHLDGLQYRLHAQQIDSKADGTPGDFSVKCDTYTSTAAHPGCVPTEVVPEPFTVVLLGSGIAGVAGISARRRRREGRGAADA